jgi:hypothetical protein
MGFAPISTLFELLKKKKKIFKEKLIKKKKIKAKRKKNDIQRKVDNKKKNQSKEDKDWCERVCCIAVGKLLLVKVE